MVLGTEHHSLAPLIAVRLAALENRLAIVQCSIGRAQGNLLIRHNARVMPALLRVVIHLKHIISEDAAKANLADIRRFLRLYKTNVCHKNTSPNNSFDNFVTV